MENELEKRNKTPQQKALVIGASLVLITSIAILRASFFTPAMAADSNETAVPATDIVTKEGLIKRFIDFVGAEFYKKTTETNSTGQDAGAPAVNNEQITSTSSAFIKVWQLIWEMIWSKIQALIDLLRSVISKI